jgi:hypothetical protein
VAGSTEEQDHITRMLHGIAMVNLDDYAGPAHGGPPGSSSRGSQLGGLLCMDPLRLRVEIILVRPLGHLIRRRGLHLLGSFDGNYLLDAGSYDTYAYVIIAPYSLTPCRKFRALPSVAAEVPLKGSKLRVLLP